MRLFLSSWYLRPGQRYDVLRPTAARARAGIVLNALDELGTGRDHHLGREVGTLADLGYVCEELDLREYFSAPSELAERLRDLDLVWVLGGNSFVLARAMVQSEFGAAVRVRLSDEAFIYGGYSAGSCMTGPDLDGIQLVDDPSVFPSGYSPDVEPACLGLMPFRILPHWRSDHPESDRIDRAEEYLAEAGLAYRCLRDGQALVVEDDEVELREL